MLTMSESPICKKEGYAVYEDTVVSFSHPDRISITDSLTNVLRAGARGLLAEAVEAEAEAFVGEHADFSDDVGRRRVVGHTYHLFVVRSPRKDAFATHLDTRRAQTSIHYPVALPELRAYAYLGQADERMMANRLDAELLSLPMGEHLSDSDVGTVCAEFKD